MSSDLDTRAIVSRFFDVWHWDLDPIEELAHPELIVTYPLFPQTVVGPVQYRHALSMVHRHFPDFSFRADSPIVDGDRAVIEWQGGGTHSGTLLGVPATGRQVSFSGISVYRVKNGRVTSERGHEDTLTLLRQMGALRSA